VAWAFVQGGVPLGLALLAALAASFVGGMLIERIIIRPVEGENELTILIVTLGLFILVNSLAGWIWGFNNRGFPRALPGGSADILGINLPYESLGIVAVLLAVVGLLYLLFQKTKLGLAMRAAAANPDSSRLVGISVGRTLAIGWGLAALLGALAGVLVAPQLFLDVNFMGGVLVYSFAAATLGGFDSPKGAVIGGWIIGVAETLAGDYIGFIGSDLTILVPLAIIFGVLLIRPNGLFGSPEVVRA
jgi:branched-chain amino acid transport system permease protein